MPRAFCERGVWPVEPRPLGGEVMDAWDGICEGLEEVGLAVVIVVVFVAGLSGIRPSMLGGKMGSSGWRMVAWRRRETRRAGGRVERYARF